MNPGNSFDFISDSSLQVIVSLSAEHFEAWGATTFAPEASFLKSLETIEGISAIETQTFTLMTM